MRILKLLDCGETAASVGVRIKSCTLLMEMQKGLVTWENSFFKKKKKRRGGGGRR